MKKILLNVLVTVALCLLCVLVMPTTAEAETVKSGTCGDNVTWELDDSGTLTISGRGNMDIFDENGQPWREKYTDAKEIKKIVVNDGVTSIGSYAFYCCRCVESVQVASSVKIIADHAFAGCSELKNILLPSGLLSIGNFAFTSCTNLKSIYIPASVRSFGQDVFQNCVRLKSAILSEGISNNDIWYV